MKSIFRFSGKTPSRLDRHRSPAILKRAWIISRFEPTHRPKPGDYPRSFLTSHLRTSITVEIVSLGLSRATIEARPERAADRAPAHGRTSLPPRGPVGCCRRGTRRPRRLIGKCRAGAAAGNVSAEGEAIRSNDYRKDTTVKAPSTRPAAVLGLDVGKSSHWACLIDRDGEVLASAPVRNRETELDALFASAPAGTLVVVDQFRNIGSLAVRRARAVLALI